MVANECTTFTVVVIVALDLDEQFGRVSRAGDDRRVPDGEPRTLVQGERPLPTVHVEVTANSLEIRIRGDRRPRDKAAFPAR